ncbi:pyroglutamyl-peptidase I [Agrococcus sp. SGAir0287]|uniref:pyroglutamyl-peptidase I n=1 Tax=Agrococcus sp. SGAir0287 TaxID=2070347 RepID=UPI0010CD3959|nr:pyroglutamyl-peptidase I [Agrococcus sp. SGAir0287]QCR18275.1 pyrrolidone-carboxylate peptidase [Agrococcus sp. SGAir0287]
MRILVTGFEPFGGDPENASREAVLRLASHAAAGDEVVTGVLPVAFATAPLALRALVDAHAPDAVLAVGEAGGRAVVTPERHGRNRMDARIPDERGDQPRGAAIDDGAPARPATLDVDLLVAAIREAGVPAEASEDAGGFVCNRIAVEVAGLGVPAAFVHVPAVRSSGVAGVGAETDAVGGAATALTIDDLATALAACVRAAASEVAAR